MQTKCRSIATFHRPIHSHWSLPLKVGTNENILVLRCSQHQYIGATSACSANRRIHTGILQLKNFRGFFKCLQHQYIGANRFAAPIYWRCTRRTQLFAAPRLIVQTMPIQSAVVSGKGNRIITRWRPN